MAPSQSATILGCIGSCLSAPEAAFFRDANPWGFILFARNIENPDQLRRLTGQLHDAVGWNAPILIDQEGGRVQRMGRPHWRKWFAPMDQITKAGPDGAARSMYLRSCLIGAELAAVGIDVSCSPMADIARPQTHPFLKNRTYGDDLAGVISAARAVADGLLASGVLPVLKHIPGHGLGSVDSHHDLPTVTASRSQLLAEDFAAFAALSDLPMAMTAHVVYEAFDDQRPATLSPILMDLIRSQIGFSGLVMTDDLSMNALPGTLAARAAGARAAGVDVILHCNGEPSEMRDVVAAAGALDAQAADRANAALARRTAPDLLDIAAVEAELELLLQGSVYDNAE
jgi:beta-N-acetylhexosaminidase